MSDIVERLPAVEEGLLRHGMPGLSDVVQMARLALQEQRDRIAELEAALREAIDCMRSAGHYLRSSDSSCDRAEGDQLVQGVDAARAALETGGGR